MSCLSLYQSIIQEDKLLTRLETLENHLDVVTKVGNLSGWFSQMRAYFNSLSFDLYIVCQTTSTYWVVSGKHKNPRKLALLAKCS